MDNVTALVTIVVAVFGSGVWNTLLRMRHDKKLGIRSQDLAEDKASDERWQGMLDQLNTNVIAPLAAEVKRLSIQVDKLDKDLAEVRSKYWRAIRLIRDVYSWIAHHIPEPPTPPPAIPAELDVDI